MNRKIILLVCVSILLLLCAGISFQFIKPVRAATTWTVDDDGPADYSSIQEAINNANSGDTIYVYNGTYYENVIVNKTVSLVGENRNATIIDAGGIGTVVLITADNVNISGFRIVGSDQTCIHLDSSNGNTINGNNLGGGIVIRMDHSNDSTVVNNTILGPLGILMEYSNRSNITGNTMRCNNNLLLWRSCNENRIIGNVIKGGDNWWGNGIVVESSSSSNTISDNIITSIGYYGTGIWLPDSHGNNIIGNTIIDNYGTGISLGGSEGNTLRNNNMTGNRWNFYVSGETLSHFIQDIDTSNTVNGKPVHYLINHSDLVIDSSTFPNIGYLALVNSTNITVKDLVLTNNGQGVLFAYTTNSIIKEITANNNSAGIRLVSSNCLVSGNNVNNNSYGIQIDGSSDCSISANYVSKNDHGVWLNDSSNVSISGNNINNNSWAGIWLSDSLNCSISGNNVNIHDNGIRLEYSSDNRIFHNNFINNTQQVYSDGSTNTWDDGYPSGGNYWSDHVCTSNPSDGSQPYVIDANNTDNYPFEDPNGWVLEGDVSGDGIVDISDVVMAGKAFASYPRHPRWDSRADMNNDGVVDIFDLVLIVKNFGKTL